MAFGARIMLVCASEDAVRVGADEGSSEPEQEWGRVREGAARFHGSQARDCGGSVPQLEGATLLLLRIGRRRNPDGSLHVPRRRDSNLWSGLLAKG